MRPYKKRYLSGAVENKKRTRLSIFVYYCILLWSEQQNITISVSLLHLQTSIPSQSNLYHIGKRCARGQSKGLLWEIFKASGKKSHSDLLGVHNSWVSPKKMALIIWADFDPVSAKEVDGILYNLHHHLRYV